MSYPFHRSNSNSSVSKPSTSFNPFKMVFIDRFHDGKETIGLLEASPISRKAHWKLCSFLHAEKKLLPKLSSYSASPLISVFGKHFDVNTHVENDQVDIYVTSFKTVFGDVRHLQPHGYYYSGGKSVTNKVRLHKRPLI